MAVGIWRVIEVLVDLSSELEGAQQRGKITIMDGINILEKVCADLGIEIDKTGYAISPDEGKP